MKPYALVTLGILAGALVGAATMHWYWTSKTEALAVMSSVSKIELNSRLLEQARRADIDSLIAGLRSLVLSGETTLDILVAPHSRFDADPQVVAARKKAAQIRTEGVADALPESN